MNDKHSADESGDLDEEVSQLLGSRRIRNATNESRIRHFRPHREDNAGHGHAAKRKHSWVREKTH